MKAARILVAAVAALALTAAVSAPIAAAAPGEPFIITGSFDGTGTPDGKFTGGDLVVNQATGRVLVFDLTNQVVRQFDESGNPVNFSAIGKPKLETPAAGVLAIDNSGGPTQGNFYILHPNNNVEGFDPSGAPLAGWPVKGTGGAFQTLNEIAVDADGDVWFSYENPGSVEEHAPDGTKTGLYIPATTFSQPRLFVWSFAFDSHNNLVVANNYFGRGQETFIYYASENYATRNQLQDSRGDHIVIDPSTDDIYLGKLQYIQEPPQITGNKFTEPFQTKPPFEMMPGVVTKGFDFSGDGQTMFVSEGPKITIFKRTPPALPQQIGELGFFEVKARGTFITGNVSTGGGAVTSYRFEFATQQQFEENPGVYPSVYPTPDGKLPHTTFGDQPFNVFVNGFEPLTKYHIRLAVTNSAGTEYGPDYVLRTLKEGDSGGIDTCENTLPRKQTGAAGTPDCRAYELVSAPYTGGYDVEAPMVQGQEPFAGFPDAAGYAESDDPADNQVRRNRVLYGVHAGVIPGPWNPTNKGVDPYLAVRNEVTDSWETEYVGLPANQSPENKSFASVLGGTDDRLANFAFAGKDLCFPCFATGLDTGVPLRDAQGQLEQALDQPAGVPDTARPEGRVAKMLSGDGSHLVFGSKYPFTAGGNNDGVNLSLYSRDLVAKTTELVSSDTGGAPIDAGAGLSELDVSDDGSRVLFATDEDEDASGNQYVNLFMHLAGTAGSAELAPLATDGVLFDGMTADGSKVFFSSAQKLTGSDGDDAADLYQAAVDGSGGVVLTLLSPDGGSCSPVANEGGAHWNTVGAGADCSAVAIGGGDGVSGNGTAYFLSPQTIGGGTANQPNLYAVAPGGTPQFVATLAPNDPMVLDSVHNAAQAEAHQFQTTPDGSFAALRSKALLTGVDNSGKTSVFLYERDAGTVLCASCNQSLTEDPTLKGEASLAKDGLTIADDGRLFFNTPAALSVEDNNGKTDVYEWVGGRPRLLSSGSGRFDSELLTTTHNGVDLFFYTHDVFDSNVDKNGERTKIYDARVLGGFFKLPVRPQCAASDECHGPGTVAPGPPAIRSSGPTSLGNVKPCKKGYVRKNGKDGKPGTCKKKPKKHKKHKKTKSKKGKKRNG